MPDDIYLNPRVRMTPQQKKAYRKLPLKDKWNLLRAFTRKSRRQGPYTEVTPITMPRVGQEGDPSLAIDAIVLEISDFGVVCVDATNRSPENVQRAIRKRLIRRQISHYCKLVIYGRYVWSIPIGGSGENRGTVKIKGAKP